MRAPSASSFGRRSLRLASSFGRRSLRLASSSGRRSLRLASGNALETLRVRALRVSGEKGAGDRRRLRVISSLLERLDPEHLSLLVERPSRKLGSVHPERGQSPP